MLDDLVAAFAADLAGRKTEQVRTIAVASFLVGLLFFLAILLHELIFSDQPLSFIDVLVLAGFSVFLSVATLLISLIARWSNKRRNVKSTKTTEWNKHGQDHEF